MAIDVREIERDYADLHRDSASRQFSYSELAQRNVAVAIRLIRAVIADEVAQQKRDQAAEKPATGDVPEQLLRNRIAELETQLADAQAEVERLSRPVEDARVLITIGCRYVLECEFQHERNAREAAESRERKLREFVRTKISGLDTMLPRTVVLTDAELDRLLAAFDKEGAKP